MSDFKKRLSKFFIILGGLFLLLFVFSLVADSANFYLIFTGILLILFGTILRKNPRNKDTEVETEETSDKRRTSRTNKRGHREDRQSRRSRRS